MHRPRTAHRWRLLMTIMGGIFLASGSFWLLQLMQRSDQNITADANRNEPDYIVEKFSFVRMSPEGQPRYLFYGAKLTHLPIDDTSQVDQPIMQNMTPDEKPMTISAANARIYHGEDKVELMGKVDIQRPASTDGQAMQLKTDALTIFPDEQRMESHQQVLMTMGVATVTGNGMRANNATRQLDITGRGKLVYPPKAAR